jgi:hypothetical protein
LNPDASNVAPNTIEVRESELEILHQNRLMVYASVADKDPKVMIRQENGVLIMTTRQDFSVDGCVIHAICP